jgi:hypothetical protein
MIFNPDVLSVPLCAMLDTEESIVLAAQVGLTGIRSARADLQTGTARRPGLRVALVQALNSRPPL